MEKLLSSCESNFEDTILHDALTVVVKGDVAV